VASVQPTEERVVDKVRNVFCIGFEGLLPRVGCIYPLHVPPKETSTRGMRVSSMIAVLVVYPVNANPPQRRPLETANPAKQPEPFEHARECNRSVGEHPVVTEIDSQRSEDEVPREYERDAPPNKNRGKKRTKSEDMNAYKGDQKRFNHLWSFQQVRRFMRWLVAISHVQICNVGILILVSFARLG